MGKKAERSNHIDGGQRQKQPDKGQYVFQSAQKKSQIGDNGKHQGDNLVFGQCRHGLRNGEHATGEDKTACVTQGNDAVVGRAENVDGNPKRKGQKQCQSAECPGGKNFPQTKADTGTGMVIIWTTVLARNSSLHSRMEMPGINRR